MFILAEYLQNSIKKLRTSTAHPYVFVSNINADLDESPCSHNIFDPHLQAVVFGKSRNGLEVF